MLGQYVSPGNKIIDLVAALQLPFTNVRRGEEVMVVTDTSMDPLICQAVMAVLRSKGADPTLMMYTPRAHHTAEPTKAVAHALAGADIVVYLTTTALAHSEFSEHRGTKGVLLMEEATVDILTSPGCQLEASDLEMILEKERWVREFWMEGGDVHVTTPAGTDLRATLLKTDKRVAKVLGILEPNGERRGAGTWPFGECRTTPLEGSGEGRVVWDICGHTPVGRYSQPVELTVKAGRVVKIEGGKEADGVRRYFETYGDENSFAAPAEISVGLNHKATIMGTVRNDKKALGTSHIAIGRSDIGGTIVSATHFDGLMAKPTITVNGRVLIKDGVLQR